MKRNYTLVIIDGVTMESICVCAFFENVILRRGKIVASKLSQPNIKEQQSRSKLAYVCYKSGCHG